MRTSRAQAWKRWEVGAPGTQTRCTVSSMVLLQHHHQKGLDSTPFSSLFPSFLSLSSHTLPFFSFLFFFLYHSVKNPNSWQKTSDCSSSLSKWLTVPSCTRWDRGDSPCEKGGAFSQKTRSEVTSEQGTTVWKPAVWRKAEERGAVKSVADVSAGQGGRGCRTRNGAGGLAGGDEGRKSETDNVKPCWPLGGLWLWSWMTRNHQMALRKGRMCRTDTLGRPFRPPEWRAGSPG